MHIIGLIIPSFIRNGLGVGAAVGAVGVAAGVVGAKKAGDRADDALDAQGKAAKQQQLIAQQQQDLAMEQWDLYKTNIYPLEKQSQELGISAQELAQQRGELDLKSYEDYYLPLKNSFADDAQAGIQADPERAAREARTNIDQSFDSAEGQMTRDLQRRGVRADSGAYNQDTSLNRAAASGMAVNSAIESERDRVEDVNFNRKATALGRQPLAANPTQSPGRVGVTAGLAGAGLASAGRTAYGSGSQFGSIGNTYGNAAASSVSGAIQLGTQAYDVYNKYKGNQSIQNYGFTPGGGASYAAGGGYGTIPWSRQSTMLAEQNAGFKDGGLVRAPGYTDGGPVNAPVGSPADLGRGAYGSDGGTVAGPAGVDQVPAYIEAPDGTRTETRLTDEEFVIPADVVRAVGTDELDDIIQRARARKAKTSDANSLTRTGGN